MRVNFVNQTDKKISKKFVEARALQIAKLLIKRKVLTTQDLKKELTVVFLKPGPAKKINLEFRQKNYATDILSFDSFEPNSLGELVICYSVIEKQAKEHKLTSQEELTYMLIHGILHLLGYDHEKSKREAKLMFQIQDEVFEQILRSKTASVKKTKH